MDRANQCHLTDVSKMKLTQNEEKTGCDCEWAFTYSKALVAPSMRVLSVSSQGASSYIYRERFADDCAN